MTTTREGETRPARIAIRRFAPGDYAQLVEVLNLADPDYPNTENELREEDAQWNHEKYVLVRYVAEDEGGRLVGMAEYNQQPWNFDPRRFSIWAGVRPDRQRQGVGGALYDRMAEDFRERGANALRAWAREDRAESTSFLERRGFTELERTWESRLDLAALDLAAFAARAKVPAGIRITTMKEELAADPDALRRIHAFGEIVGADVPRLDPYTPPDFETWRRHVDGSWVLPEAWFLAKDGDAIVGQSDLGRSEAEPDVLYTGLTATLREYRGRGIARALKLRALTWAKERGYREVRTWNSTRNAPMLSINVAIGFRRQPAWITYAKDLGGA